MRLMARFWFLCFLFLIFKISFFYFWLITLNLFFSGGKLFCLILCWFLCYNSSNQLQLCNISSLLIEPPVPRTYNVNLSFIRFLCYTATVLTVYVWCVCVDAVFASFVHPLFFIALSTSPFSASVSPLLPCR